MNDVSPQAASAVRPGTNLWRTSALDHAWERFYDRALAAGHSPEAARDLANARLDEALADR